ncbi:DcaP family trimeric outer membrane transporter [Ancylomarina longa]|uniref:Porin n=1 Tax=Ancylomarina longa TaxID=2487017 RepID=A0A434AGP0_9BACT|nr:DcaP family trimeric outer membrane transporter [Ancylomarina longa]RUT73553.1 hypothetical protein DLK05_12665 [Ancylomarina longa]
MKRLNYLLILLVFLGVSTNELCAQKKLSELPISLKIGGYVHSAFTFDSRQTVSAREGHVLLYPKNVFLDPAGRDINAASSYNMAVIQSRTWMRITGPEILGAKTTGLLEAEFMGNSEADVNGFRIRHAYVNLDWGKTSLLIGQTWAPLFVVEVMPGQIGTNSGLPFKPFARNPQVRFTYKSGKWKLLAALLSERDYTSTGPDGSSNKYLRNAGLPMAQGQIHFYPGKHIFGVTGEVKNIKPALMTSTGYKADETLTSWSVLAYAKLNFKPFTFKIHSTYGSNLTDVLMTGGYAAKSINPVTNEASYTPIKILAGWCDLDYTPGKIGFGIFGGYSKNLGADDKVVSGMVYSRGSNIGELYRIAPRITASMKNMKIQLESEYTAAAYGVINENAEVDHQKWVGNNRITLGLYYFF